ncbi:hypothetical protein [Bradyrhizobium retamae]|uniref:hypothetical protein n=1 Tax=Bradyrhizobium retamae TaxID=1300035 RepID=UPI0012E33186|nr:hypothetical protein [Bradyrhizobium retamae]
MLNFCTMSRLLQKLAPLFRLKEVVQVTRLQMNVGAPKKISAHNYRVGLPLGAIREYVAAGHRVVVKANAGVGATDDTQGRRNDSGPR